MDAPLNDKGTQPHVPDVDVRKGNQSDESRPQGSTCPFSEVFAADLSVRPDRLATWRRHRKNTDDSKCRDD